MCNVSFRAIFCIAAMATTAQFALAQFSSAIQGIVQDQTGAVVPNATVTLTNLSTGVSLKTQSTESGVYRFSSLAPTRYEVSAQSAGLDMKPVEVTLLTDQTAGVNLTLAVAGSAQQVVVTDQTPAISTDDSRLQTTVRAEQLHDLPLQGRNFLGLVAVAPRNHRSRRGRGRGSW